MQAYEYGDILLSASPSKRHQEKTNQVRPIDSQKIPVKELLKYYHDMLLIRRFEEKAGQVYGMGKIAGFCHLYIGQEAIVVGVQSALSDIDTVITAYRDHGHMLACGMDPGGVMAELMGRATGYSKGKGGSMHMFSREKNFMGGHGIVGANVSLGTGIALAHKYRNNKAVSVTYYGDGTTNQGQVFESFNMAALWKLPVIYVIENNQYAMGTSVERSAALPDQLYNRGSIFGIPGYKVDGMDILTVKAAAEMAVNHVREGNGPIILEMNTYRYRGHSMSDPAKYRSREEVDSVKAKSDPIQHMLALLHSRNVAEEHIKEIDHEIKEAVAQAVDFAENSPEPDAAELWTDIYTEANT